MFFFNFYTNTQVRGHVSQDGGKMDAFGVEISDFAINIEVNINDGTYNNVKAEVAGYRSAMKNIFYCLHIILHSRLQEIIFFQKNDFKLKNVLFCPKVTNIRRRNFN